jgi:hypothetical protein
MYTYTHTHIHTYTNKHETIVRVDNTCIVTNDMIILKL